MKFLIGIFVYREKYDVTVNALNVNIHFGDAYKLSNGALQPNKAGS